MRTLTFPTVLLLWNRPAGNLISTIWTIGEEVYALASFNNYSVIFIQVKIHIIDDEFSHCKKCIELALGFRFFFRNHTEKMRTQQRKRSLLNSESTQKGESWNKNISSFLFRV